MLWVTCSLVVDVLTQYGFIVTAKLNLEENFPLKFLAEMFGYATTLVLQHKGREYIHDGDHYEGVHQFKKRVKIKERIHLVRAY